MHWNMLRYASAELKNDKDIVLVAVAQDGDALQYASEELKKDKEVVKAAKKVVMAAVAQNGRALRWVEKWFNSIKSNVTKQSK